MVRTCAECIHLGLPYTLRCQFSTEESRACKEIETRASFLIDAEAEASKERVRP